MNTVVMLSQKGGSTKTTLAVHCAVAAQESGVSVALADTDPQGTAYHWGNARGNPPTVAKVSARQAVSMIERGVNGAELLIVDTPPHSAPDALLLARAASLVVIPCRPTSFDLSAVQSTVNIVRASQSQACIVLSACPPRAPETEQARTLLADCGFPIYPRQITERRSFARAVASGRAVTEFETNGQGADEIRSLWQYLKEFVSHA